MLRIMGKELTTAQLLTLHGTRRQQLVVETEEVRVRLASVIRAAVAEGIRQVDIVRATGYTREQIRNITAGRTRASVAERVA